MENGINNLLKGYNMLLYFTGSMIMNEPTEECVIDFWANGSLKRLPVSSSNPKFMKAAAVLRDPCADKENCRKLLASDFKMLFSAEGEALALPVASAYSSEKSKIRIATPQAEYFYNSFGWKNAYLEKPPDHLGIELLFLTRLIEKFMLLDDIPCRNEMKREIALFLEACILSWLPSWNEKVQEHAASVQYKGIGMLICACIEDLYGIFSTREARYNN